MTTYISSVGTSLLGNTRNFLGLVRPQTPTDDDFRRYFENESVVTKLSAEINALSRLQVGPEDRITFIHSDTEDGSLCARQLSRYFENQGISVKCLKIPSLTYQASDFKNRGLRELVALLLDEIKKEKKSGHEVILDATGGFKAQIAFSVLVGQVWQIPVYYIHEEFKDIVQMPPVPLTWDSAVFEEARSFLDWLLRGDGDPAELNTRLNRYAPETQEKLKLMAVEESGSMQLSATGYVFYEKFEELKPKEESSASPIWLCPASNDGLSKLNAVERQTMDGLIEELSDPDVRKNNTESKKTSDMRFYPTSRKGNGWRVGFAPHPDDKDAVVVYCTFTNHDEYIRALDGGLLTTSRFSIAPLTLWQPG